MKTAIIIGGGLGGLFTGAILAKEALTGYCARKERYGWWWAPEFPSLR